MAAVKQKEGSLKWREGTLAGTDGLEEEVSGPAGLRAGQRGSGQSQWGRLGTSA